MHADSEFDGGAGRDTSTAADAHCHWQWQAARRTYDSESEGLSRNGILRAVSPVHLVISGTAVYMC